MQILNPSQPLFGAKIGEPKKRQWGKSVPENFFPKFDKTKLNASMNGTRLDRDVVEVTIKSKAHKSPIHEARKRWEAHPDSQKLIYQTVAASSAIFLNPGTSVTENAKSALSAEEKQARNFEKKQAKIKEKQAALTEYTDIQKDWLLKIPNMLLAFRDVTSNLPPGQFDYPSEIVEIILTQEIIPAGLRLNQLNKTMKAVLSLDSKRTAEGRVWTDSEKEQFKNIVKTDPQLYTYSQKVFKSASETIAASQLGQPNTSNQRLP